LRLKKLGNLIQETIGGRAIHPVNAVPGGFGRVPATEHLIELRGALIEGVKDSDAVIDLMASLPGADFCHCNTVFAALDSAGRNSYYAGEEVIVASNGDRSVVRAADYRMLAAEESVPHSHAKHSRFLRKPFMVGSLARLTINPHRITGKLVLAAGALWPALTSR